MSDTKLKGIVDELEASASRTASEGEHRRSIYKRAEEGGYNAKALRKIMQARKMKAAEREALEHDIAAYELALGMAVELVRGGMSLRRAEKETGVSKSAIHREISVPQVSHEAPVDEAGEVSEEISPKSKPACIMPVSTTWKEITSARDEHEAAIAAAKEAERARRRAEREARAAENARIDADTLDIPPFLRRSAA